MNDLGLYGGRVFATIKKTFQTLMLQLLTFESRNFDFTSRNLIYSCFRPKTIPHHFLVQIVFRDFTKNLGFDGNMVFVYCDHSLLYTTISYQ